MSSLPFVPAVQTPLLLAGGNPLQAGLKRRIGACLLLLPALSLPALAEDDSAEVPAPQTPAAGTETGDTTEQPPTQSAPEKKGSPVTARYDKGLHFETDDNSFAARIRWRLQTRLTDLSSSDLVGEEDGVEEEAGFQVRRARFKLDGHAYEEWLKYYLEYGIAASALLTWQFDLDKYEEASLRVGQYKVLYNRERIDSSGKQQFVDRSIVNSPFTVDRQQGFTLMGRLFNGSHADSRYALGVFTGTGRGGGLEADERPMYVGRWQWNFLGRDVPFSQSDIKYTPETAASFALAGATNRGQFTSWSSAGGGQLPGLDDGEYRTEQWMAEFALLRQGLSLQSEYHRKDVDDLINGGTTSLEGWYGQVGYFFHALYDPFPKDLELALRFAKVDAGDSLEIPADREATLAANYFFAGHNNKLTLDISRLESTIGGGGEDDGWRARLQWDITF